MRLKHHKTSSSWKDTTKPFYSDSILLRHCSSLAESWRKRNAILMMMQPRFPCFSIFKMKTAFLFGEREENTPLLADDYFLFSSSFQDTHTVLYFCSLFHALDIRLTHYEYWHKLEQTSSLTDSWSFLPFLLSTKKSQTWKRTDTTANDARAVEEQTKAPPRERRHDKETDQDLEGLAGQSTTTRVMMRISDHVMWTEH